ncbi:MAG TPA: DUF192 domain-containing protein [Azospirillaceae bacterium]|nr:DUF192 domain-containing protein [Azospirillaceae bacterium]
MRSILLRLFLLVLLVPGTVPAGAAEIFEKSSVVIETAKGGRFRFDVELAQTPGQMAQGMMFRERMAEDAGMLFLMAAEQPVSFWMKNTLIPLDMLFVGADGRIRSIHANAVPRSLASIPSGAPVKAVLEINGGMAARLGIRPGDRVIHAAFK